MRGRILGRIDVACGEVIERAHDLIHDVRQPGGAGGAAAVLLQHRLGHLHAGRPAVLETIEHGRARFRRGGRFLRHQRRKLAAQGLAVDQLIQLERDFRHMRRNVSSFRRRLYPVFMANGMGLSNRRPVPHATADSA
jgi:hypothetical protein